jgi:hypothetical protein
LPRRYREDEPLLKGLEVGRMALPPAGGETLSRSPRRADQPTPSNIP